MWDVAIVGAGPAGATAALAARRAAPDARVLLLDRADFPRDKSCGDGVAPHVLDVLAPLGAGDLLADLVPVSTLELALDDWTTARPMRRPAYVVPRTVLDARLVQRAVGAGAELRRHRVREVRLEHESVVLDDTHEARVVIAADGAHSIFRGALGLPPAGRTALALRGYVPTPPERAARQVIRFGRSRQPSYAWSFDRGDGWSNVGYGELLQPSRPAPTRQLMLDRLEAMLPGSVPGGEGWRGHHLPLSGVRVRQPGGRVLLVGDAAALVNPLTGEGIYYAVATGARAGELAVTRPADQAGDRHRRRVRRLLGRHLLTTAGVSRLAGTDGLLPAGLRAAEADQDTFDDLVEIGLGRGLLTPRLVGGIARQHDGVRPGVDDRRPDVGAGLDHGVAQQHARR